MKAHQLKTLAAFTSLAVALSSVAQPVSALTVPEAITSIQSSNPTLPTGVSNPKGNIGFLLANMFWNSSDVGYDSTKFGKIKPTYFDGAGATAWTYAGGNTYMTDMNGRVGIGTNDPQAYLHLKSNLNDNSPALLLESPAAQYGSPRIALVDTSSGSVSARPAWMVDNSFDRFRVFRQPNLTTPGLAHLLINGSGSVSVGSQVDVFNAKASFEVRRGEADSEYAAWIEGMNSNNLGLGVNIANTSSAKGIANFKSGNVSRLFVRADGNVGIGTTAPDSALDVNGDISGYTRFKYTSVNGDYFWLRSRIGTEPNALSIGIGSDETTGTTKDIRMLTNGVGRFYISQDGKIGMGTFSPSATLDVVGEAKAVNGTFTDAMSQSLTQGALKLSGTNGAVVIDDAGQKRISWNDAGGNFNLRGGNYYQNGLGVVYAKGASDSNGGAATVTISSDVADGSVTINAAPIGTPGSLVNYTNYFNVNATNSYFGGGNVGIGTSAPGAKLEVAGQIKITGGAPGAGKVLTSDASGLATWTSPASYAESDPKIASSATNYLSKWNGSQLVNSSVFDDGTNVGVGTAIPAASLEIKRNVADSNYAAWIEGTNASNFGLGVNIANTWMTKAVADFRSNNVSRLQVRADGNVGIGTTTPSATLNVVGTTHLSRDNVSSCCSAAGDYTLSLAESTVSTGKMSAIQFHNSGVSEGYVRLAGSGPRRFQMGDYQGVGTWLQMSGNLQVDGAGNSYFSGSVGIGTSAPAYKLDVAGDILANWYIRTQGTAGWYSQTYGGGWYMSDSTWIRTIWSKSIWVDSWVLGSQGWLTVWYGGTSPNTSAGGIIAGSVGIGTSAPAYKLDVAGDIRSSGQSMIRNASPTVYLQDTDGRSAMIHNNSNLLYILRGCGNDTQGWCTYSNGYWPLQINLENNDAIFGGNVNAFGYFYNSDRRFKEDVVWLGDSLEKISKLNGYSFKWKSDWRKDIGVIAQEVEAQFPEIVRTDEKTGMKSVEYGNLVAPLIESVKELKAIADGQSKVISEQQKKIDELSRKISGK